MADDAHLLDWVQRALDEADRNWAVEMGRSRDGDERALAGDLAEISRIARFHKILQSGGNPVDALGADAVAGMGAAGPPAAPAVSRWGKLRIERKLGEGSFAEVYLALDPDLDREVALKLYKLDAAALKKRSRDVLREGRMMARVRHPNLAVVHGADEIDGRVGLWMDYVEGRSLEQALEDHGPFSASEAALIGIDLCRALAAIHAKGLVHQDVKPENVLREAGGRIVLMDLGLGREVATPAGDAWGAAGTPYYMPPEALIGGRVSKSGDIYSLGVLLFRLVTRSYPIEAENMQALVQAHRAGRRVFLRDLRPDLPKAFIEAVEKAMAPDPALRFASMGEMERALTAALEGRAPEAELVRRRSFGGALGWAFAGLVILIVAGLLLRERGTGVRPESGTVATGERTGKPPAPASSPHVLSVAFQRQAGTHAEDLRDGDAVRRGDVIFAKFSASRPTYVYVLSCDDKGEMWAQFPLRGFDLVNPLPADTSLTLPGRLEGKLQGWQVLTRALEERFVIVASAERRLEVEEEMANLPEPSRRGGSGPVRLSRGAVRAFRGMGGLAELPEDDASSEAATFEELYRKATALSDSPDTIGGLWLRRVHLLQR